MVPHSDLVDGSRITVLGLPGSFPLQSEPLSTLHVPANTNMDRSYSGFHKARNAIKNDIAYASGDSSADEEVEHPSVAPAPDAEITYSYDAERGPNHGSQILNLALDKAMEHYEVRQTDKLIKDEYEVLDVDAEALSPGPKVVRKGLAAEDEDYEFIDA